MTNALEIARLIERAVAKMDYNTRSYSGRGMGGKECLAVDVDNGSEARAVCMVIRGLRDITRDESELNDVLEALEATRSDSMGHGRIVYWPSLPYPPNIADGECTPTCRTVTRQVNHDFCGRCRDRA